MNDIILSVIIFLLVALGWGSIILRDFAIVKGETKKKWVHHIAAILIALSLIWIALSF